MRNHRVCEGGRKRRNGAGRVHESAEVCERCGGGSSGGAVAAAAAQQQCLCGGGGSTAVALALQRPSEAGALEGRFTSSLSPPLKAARVFTDSFRPPCAVITSVFGM